MLSLLIVKPPLPSLQSQRHRMLPRRAVKRQRQKRRRKRKRRTKKRPRKSKLCRYALGFYCYVVIHVIYVYTTPSDDRIYTILQCQCCLLPKSASSSAKAFQHSAPLPCGHVNGCSSPLTTALVIRTWRVSEPLYKYQFSLADNFQHNSRYFIHWVQ
jgi:hypothetical protein